MDADRTRILLVEDDEDDYRLTRDMLADIEDVRYDVEWVHTYDAALDALRQNRHDACLLDYRLGERTGLDLLRDARAAGCRMPIILLTGQGTPDIDVAAMKAGAADYLTKDTTRAQALDRAIRYAREHKRAEEDLRRARERFESLVQSIDGIVWEADAATFRFTFVSRQAERLLGYPLAQWQAPNFWRDHLHPDDRERALAYCLEETAKLRDHRCQYRMIAADGRIVWLDDLISVTAKDGKPATLRGVMVDISEQRRIEEALRTSLAEKDVLLKEVHHRVKNNLQVIASLLSLQRIACRDAKARQLLRDSQDRVRAMATVHETLYQSPDLARVSAADYLRRLTEHLFHSSAGMAGRVTLSVKADPVPLSPEAVIPCGLLLNELVSNSLKHAFPDGRRGEIRIRLAEGPDRGFILVVQDDGVGLPETVDPARSASLGLQLVGQLTAQMGGTVSVDRAGGTTWTIRVDQTPASFTQAGP
jgi:PAS domain S-box-containing protein